MKKNDSNYEETAMHDKNNTGRFMLIAAALVLGGVLISSLQAAGALTTELDENAVTTASGVKIDPAKHRSATFRMW